MPVGSQQPASLYLEFVVFSIYAIIFTQYTPLHCCSSKARADSTCTARQDGPHYLGRLPSSCQLIRYQSAACRTSFYTSSSPDCAEHCPHCAVPPLSICPCGKEVQTTREHDNSGFTSANYRESHETLSTYKGEYIEAQSTCTVYSCIHASGSYGRCSGPRRAGEHSAGLRGRYLWCRPSQPGSGLQTGD